MYPLKIKPVTKDYIWGGRRLKNEYGIETDLNKVAEAWMLSCLREGKSVIENGKYKGMSLQSALMVEKNKPLGTNGEKFSKFPILIKLIDAEDNLSVQVHPDEAYASCHEDAKSKTEAWYIVDCEEDAQLVYGFKRKTSAKEVRQRIADDTLFDILNTVDIKKGDMFFIEAGTIHAICGGILIAEIQQSSNTTYRVFDYGRVDDNGNQRELHVDKALEVAKFEKPKYGAYPNGETKKVDGGEITQLIECEYFTVNKIAVDGDIKLSTDEKSFSSLLCVDGEGTFAYKGKDMSFNKGESIFVPADAGEYTINGNCTVLETKI